MKVISDASESLWKKQSGNILNWYVLHKYFLFTYFQGKHPVLKALFIFITEKAESLHTIPPTGSFLIQESAGWFFVTTHGLTSFFFCWMVGKASAKRAENRIWREESCLALGATWTEAFDAVVKTDSHPSTFIYKKSDCKGYRTPLLVSGKWLAYFFFPWLLH